MVAAAAAHLLPLLPQQARDLLVGGERSAHQLAEGDRDRLLRRAVVAHPGTNGVALLDAARTLTYIQGYAQARGWAEADTWPVSRAVAASWIEGEHERATDAARGSKKGGTVGHRMRGSLKALRDHFGCPIDLEGPLVAGAAPASAPGAPSQAATLPFQVYAQLEIVARRAAAPALAGGADVPRFFARSLLLIAFTSVRLRDAVRVCFSPHPSEPDTMVYGIVSNKRGSKDGAPMELFAPAEGFLGPLPWLAEHLRSIGVLGGVAFPNFCGPRGCRTHIHLAEGVLASSCLEPTDVRAVFESLLTLPPLKWSKADYVDSGLRGHSFHGSLSDLARAIGPSPSLAFSVPASVALGFADSDVNELGRWERSAAEKAAARAAAARGAGHERNAAPPPPASAMSLRYSSGAGRLGCHEAQMRVRTRMLALVRAALLHYGREWSSLPHGLASWRALFPASPLDLLTDAPEGSQSAEI